MIEVITKYTKESVKKYYRFHMLKKRVVSKICLAILIICGFFLLFLSLFTDDSSPVIIGIASIILAASPFYFPAINTNILYKKSPAVFDTGSTIHFLEDHFSITMAGEYQSGTNDIKYEALVNVYEIRDFFYLYIQPNMAYIVDKSDFTQGSPEELSQLFAQVLPGKKFCRYKK